jgi:hypothetical protein
VTSAVPLAGAAAPTKPDAESTSKGARAAGQNCSTRDGAAEWSPPMIVSSDA